MINNIINWLREVKEAATLAPIPNYVISYQLPGTSNTLYIYSIIGVVPQYKLILSPENSKVLRQKYIHKLFSDRDPTDELATGVHDAVITKFIGVPFNAKEVIK